jgi:lipopolysaccharide export system protein LptA
MISCAFCRPFLFLLVFLSSVCAVSPVLAERADREKPIALEADRVTVDDIKRVQTLEGNVVLTQGTLTIFSNKIIITEDNNGFQHGTALGGPGGLARFRQKRDNSEEWIEGEGERIEYNTRTEVAEIFQRAWIKNGNDELQGDYIWYDALAERYLAAAGGPKNTGRVRVLLHPKNKDAPVVEAAPNSAVPPSAPPASGLPAGDAP